MYRLLLFLFFLPAPLFAQDFFRVKADFSLKEKTADGKTMLTMGKVYFDKRIKKVVYHIKFPKNETWVMADSLFYRMVNDTLVEKQKIPALAEVSIFNICLQGKLANYGLDNFNYKMYEVEKADGMVITTWLPPEKLKKTFGKIVLSQKEKQLYGIAYFGPDGNLLNKQFFKKYTHANGLDFPLEIIQISYHNQKESYQVTTYKNLVVNEMENDDWYNVVIPR